MTESAAGLAFRLWCIALMGLAVILFGWHQLAGEWPPQNVLILGAVILGLPVLLWLATRGGASEATPEQGPGTAAGA